MQNEDCEKSKIIMSDPSKNPVHEYSNQEIKTQMEITSNHPKEHDSSLESIKIQSLQDQKHKESKKEEYCDDYDQKTSAAENGFMRWDDTEEAFASSAAVEEERRTCSGRERLKRHRVEMAGRVWIPEMWGQEDLLKDWIDCSAFDASFVESSIMSARAALMEEGRRDNPCTRLQTIENSC